MSLPQGYYPPVLPPDPEWLGQAFLTPILTPTPVATRLPSPTDLQVSLPGFMRIEAGDTNKVPDVYGAAWDVTFLMHAYHPDEVQAAQIRDRSIACVCAATGLIVVGWYIVSVPNFVGGRRLTDPLVPASI